jgi:DNA-binding NtrC family response regulator
MVALLHHDFPYNVRELEAAIKRAVALAASPRLEVELLPDAIREAVADYGRPAGAADAPYSAEDAASGLSAPSEAELRAMLVAHHGNVAAVGRELGKARMQIHRWMKRYGIEVDEYRG